MITIEQAQVSVMSQLPDGDKVSLVGGLACAAGRLVSDGDRNQLHLTPGDACRLGIRHRQSIGFWRAEDSVQLGPYIGIMTNKRPGGLGGFQGLRGRRENYVALLKTAREMGALAYVFACEDIDFTRMRVVGYQRTSAGKWLAREFPLPNVVYNRVPDRKSEVSSVVRMAKKRFEKLGLSKNISLFNPHFLNKWDLHRILDKDPRIRMYLPDTRVYHGSADLSSMLTRHRMVYLKPKDTFAGQGIMRAEYKAGKFFLSYKLGSVYKHDQFGNFSSLTHAFTSRRRSGVYLVQQGLRLAKYKGAMFDARILLQKTGEGVWDITGVGVRVAAQGGITTHVPNGGYIESIETIITQVFKEQLDTKGGIYSRIKALALTIAPAIERHYRRMFGELSMDIGITNEGDCYFFEANAKPMKFDEPNIRRKSLCRLVEFSRYLAGYARVMEKK